MIPDIDYLSVSIDGKTVGRVAMDERRCCVFEYTPEWIKDGFSISPFYLPLESGAFTAKYDPFEGLFGVFNDSLPDGWGNLLIDRWLKEQGINPGELSWVERLSIVGNSGMGALCYEPEIWKAKKEEIRSLDFYASEVDKVLHEEPPEALDELVEKAGSPGGARPKVLLHMEGKEWLIKFRAQNDPANIGELEYTYAQAAIASGIEMPETKLFEDTYFGSVRFDRENDKKIHMITASGLLHASHRYPSLDYIELMKATLQLTESMPEVYKIFRRMVFNVLTRNKDDHAKNFSFLFRDGVWKVSPAYDLVLSDGFNGNHSTTIAGKGNPEKKDLFESAVKAGLSKQQCKLIYEEVEEATEKLNKKVQKLLNTDS